MKTITIRNLPPAIAGALEREARLRGQSPNRTVIDLLGEALGVAPVRSNGLAKLAGEWSEEEFQRFEADLTDLGAFLSEGGPDGEDQFTQNVE